jgi:hypothetical protein
MALPLSVQTSITQTVPGVAGDNIFPVLLNDRPRTGFVWVVNRINFGWTSRDISPDGGASFPDEVEITIDSLRVFFALIVERRIPSVEYVPITPVTVYQQNTVRAQWRERFLASGSHTMSLNLYVSGAIVPVPKRSYF